ncbi:hypothetical protein [Candidatus Thiosymbion oneisti]|uniref:hypothetical protein n=2 Tax=Candidatus Thiosymbion oneisti TaxID=589554 RepID=UPI001A9C6DF0|nr:hypothetical protein [Candidatus Thiosymbion oneisti]
MRSRMPNLCALCGINLATTKDHIPPRGIYPKAIRHGINFNTVPACKECNNGASMDDEEFKMFVGFNTGEYQEHPEIVIDSLAGTIGNNKKIANQIFATKKNVYAYRGRSVLEPAVAVMFNGRKLSKVISRVIRGLYWEKKGKALGYKSDIQIFMPQYMQSEFFRSMKDVMDCSSPNYLNRKTFVYKCQFCEDGSSIWGMQFFKKLSIFGYAEAPKT